MQSILRPWILRRCEVGFCDDGQSRQPQRCARRRRRPDGTAVDLASLGEESLAPEAPRQRRPQSLLPFVTPSSVGACHRSPRTRRQGRSRYTLAAREHAYHARSAAADRSEQGGGGPPALRAPVSRPLPVSRKLKRSASRRSGFKEGYAAGASAPQHPVCDRYHKCDAAASRGSFLTACRGYGGQRRRSRGSDEDSSAALKAADGRGC